MNEPVCRVCGGYGFVAQKHSVEDGYGEAETCPACDKRDAEREPDPATLATELRAALYQIVQQWRPIESAPNDGTQLMLWVVPRPDSQWPGFAKVHTGRLHIGTLLSWCSLETATHWMPLPDPPVSAQDRTIPHAE